MSIVSRSLQSRCGKSPKLDWEGLPTPARDFFRVNLERRMGELGLSDSELGRRCGVAPSTIGRYLIGERYPSLETLEKLCAVLEMTASELLAGPSDRQPITVDQALKMIAMATKKH